MTNEQWLVYLYSVWPDGEFFHFWMSCLCIWGVYLLVLGISYSEPCITKEERQQKLWVKLGYKKIIVPVIICFMMLISHFVPDKKTFAYIIVTPYVVDTGKSLVESLQDPSSKAYKINKMIDKGLDKALEALENTENKIETKVKKVKND